MKIDVIMCTKNSERMLKECLISIYKEIPVCHLIIVDGFSEDRTLEIIKYFKYNYKNIQIIQTKAKLGKAREIGIKNVDTEWFAFIDSDVILPKGWFEKLNKYINFSKARLGAIEGNYIHHYPEGTLKFPESKDDVDGKRVDPRGYTIATMIKREVVEGIEIPDDLQIYEDEFIKRWIEKKGFTWVKIAEPVVDHFPTPKPFKDAYLTGVYSIRYNLFSPVRIIAAFLLFPFKFFYLLCITRSFTASMNSVIYNFFMLKGLTHEVLGVSADRPKESPKTS